MGLFLVLFGGVALVLFLVSHCLIPFSSHKSCGVFQVSVEGHWTYSGTYVLVLRLHPSSVNTDLWDEAKATMKPALTSALCSVTSKTPWPKI